MNANEISPKADLRMRRIQKVSKIVRAFFLAMLIIQGLGMAVGVVILPLVIIHSSSYIVFTIYSSLLAYPFAFMANLNFFRLFSQFKDGHLFETQTIKFLENAGKWWIVTGIVQSVFQFLGAYIFSHILITGPYGIVGGLIVFFIAWLLGEAQKLQEEQELTV